MKYFFVVGEASADLHASNMMKALKAQDSSAEFMYVGGSMMREVGGTCVMKSEELAFMGFIEVLKHMGDIRRGAHRVQHSLRAFSPDVVICIDYAGFNFRYVLPFIKTQLPSAKCVYYIPPKVWAWKKGRVKTLQTHTDLVLCIFPFEKSFLEKNGLSQVKYVGNPSLDAIREFDYNSIEQPLLSKPYIALVPGSRISEIRSNLPAMLEAASHFPDYEVVVTAAPGIDPRVYENIKGIHRATVHHGETYRLIKHAAVALVTSGTATLETALIGTPQVVCYAVKGGGLANFVFRNFFAIPYISLVNIVAEKEVVKELYGGKFRVGNIVSELRSLLQDKHRMSKMLKEYREIKDRLETPQRASEHAANEVIKLMSP
ncbi:lipid-A-disaccharide synthase [Porphyromonas sp.]|uniref:lipid-A-disaccharide synthase n=1 Tax=Porphyromonas sp. TaxID=1924944 RepID=UPI0026DB3003|nr:lipid-A-disaccharide synthase [Porphyromonas sp.]MDO4695466.1 lipid-A-disaccharide synthase [Porphyromonas sp.]MDO4770344.1 lipid-A-disaccharide synthase [Porphyromonas sp.]